MFLFLFSLSNETVPSKNLKDPKVKALDDYRFIFQGRVRLPQVAPVVQQNHRQLKVPLMAAVSRNPPTNPPQILNSENNSKRWSKRLSLEQCPEAEIARLQPQTPKDRSFDEKVDTGDKTQRQEQPQDCKTCREEEEETLRWRGSRNRMGRGGVYIQGLGGEGNGP